MQQLENEKTGEEEERPGAQDGSMPTPATQPLASERAVTAQPGVLTVYDSKYDSLFFFLETLATID